MPGAVAGGSAAQDFPAGRQKAAQDGNRLVIHIGGFFRAKTAHLATGQGPAATSAGTAKKDKVDAKRKEKLAAAQEKAKGIQDVTIGITARAGQDGKLFGSVSTADVADAFAKSGVTVDRRWVEIREIIRTTGEFQGAVRLHPQVRATFKIQVQAAG